MTFALLFAGSVIIFGLIAWRDVPKAVTVLAALLPTYLVRGSLGGIPFTLLEAFILALGVVWIVKHGRAAIIDANEMETRVRKCWLGLLGAILAVAALSVFISPERAAALGVFKAYVAEPILLFLIINHVVKTHAQKQQVLVGLIAGGMVVAVSALIQWIFDAGIPAPWDVERRTTGLFPYPNAAGLYLAPLLTLAIVWLMRAADAPKRVLVPFLVLGTLAIITTQTEAAWIAVPAAAFVAGLMLPAWRKRVLAVGAVVIVLALIGPWRGTVVEKLTLQDYSGGIRRTQWSEAVMLLKDHPVAGAGLAGYPTAIAPYHKDASIEIFQYPHNLILNQWMETGILGVLLLLGLIVVAARGWMKTPDALAFAAGAALLTMCVHGLVDVPFWKNDLAAMTWILFALLAPYALRERSAQ